MADQVLTTPRKYYFFHVKKMRMRQAGVRGDSIFKGQQAPPCAQCRRIHTRNTLIALTIDYDASR
jgi:hypothetical protein